MRPHNRVLLIASILGIMAGPATGQQLLDPKLLVETTPTGAIQATGLRFVAANEFFVIEKATGRVLHNLDGIATEVLNLPVNSNSERGLLGIALHPDFANQPFVYLYFSVSSSNDDTFGRDQWLSNVLSRFTWNGAALVNEVTLFAIPRILGGENGPNHDGGPLQFGPDGKLYLVTGDLNREATEQNFTPGGSFVSAFTGGVHRFNPDGTNPDDNPFNVVTLDAPFHDLFAYGVRNSFGLGFDPVTGMLWDTENGFNDMDEINLVESGFNSGWKTLMGPESRNAQSSDDLVDLLPGTSFYSDPEFSFASPIGVTSIGFLAGSNLGPAFDDRVWIGANNTTDIFELELNPARDAFVLEGGLADKVADGASEVAQIRTGTGFFIPTDMQLDPDGNPTILSFSGNLYRVFADGDEDGIKDTEDNCSEVANAGQEDVDVGLDDDSSLPGIQHYGDACDVDLDNDGIVGASDFFGEFRPCLGADLGASPECGRADLDGDGIVGPSDFFARMRPAIGTAPGPGVTEP